MERFNCIVVFDQRKEKTLFCKRVKDPYKGLYNFVGGKAEDGEAALDAAYRELFEETGISREDISLYRLMDITYHCRNFILEIFSGILNKDMELREEKNPLFWLGLHEDFCNPEIFAGDRNIGHIMDVARLFSGKSPVI